VFSSQDNTFAEAFSILKNAIAARAFPAASVAITRERRLVALKAFGHLTYEENPKGGSFAVTPATLFDLASLTKVLTTTTMAMLLYERGQLGLALLYVTGSVVLSIAGLFAGLVLMRHLA